MRRILEERREGRRLNKMRRRRNGEGEEGGEKEKTEEN